MNLKSRNTGKYVLVNKEKPGEVYKLEFKSKLDGCEVRAKLLERPCLKASYLIKNVEVNTLITDEATKVTFFLDTHCLSFQCDDELLAQRSNSSSFKKNRDKNLSCSTLSFDGSKINKEADLEYKGNLLLTNRKIKQNIRVIFC